MLMLTLGRIQALARRLGTDLVGGKTCSGANGSPGAGTPTPDTARIVLAYNSANG